MHNLIQKLITAINLPMDHWAILIKSWCIMLYVRLRMDLTPFKSWKHWLENHNNEIHKPLNESQKSTIVTHRRMMALASRYHLINANCLPKSLTLMWMLEKQKIHCDLQLGLRLDKRELHGHAWLQRNDIVLNDDHDVALRYPIKQQINQKPLHF